MVWTPPLKSGNNSLMRSTATLWRCGYDFRRFLSIEEWFSQDREAYYAALQLGCPTNFYEDRHDPDHSPWLAFFAGVVRQAAAALAQQVQRLQARQGPMTPTPGKHWIGAADNCYPSPGPGCRRTS